MQEAAGTETYVEGHHGGLVCGLVLGLGGLLGAAFVHAGPIGLAPPLIAGLVWWRLARGRRAIEVDSTGLTERFGLGLARFHAWSDVASVEVHWDPGQLYRSGHDAAVIVTQQGRLVVDSRLPDWLRLVRRVERSLGDSAARTEDERGDVDEAEMAGWLGIERGATLECRMSRDAVRRAWRVLGVSGVLVAALVAVAAYGLGSFPWGPPEHWPQPEPWYLPASFILLSVALGLAVEFIRFALRLRRQTTRISAGVDGLTVVGAHGRRQVAWHELVQIRRTPREEGAFFSEEGWIVTHETGELRLFDWQTHAARLASTIENVLLAGRAGRRLTVDEPLPEGAISLLRGGRNDAARGLSRIESDPPADG